MKNRISITTTKPRYFLGIDPGVNTGLALWDSNAKAFTDIQTVKIHTALDYVKNLSELLKENLLVIVEDARKRKHDRGLTDEKKQGAGSIKRDCKIWEDFLTEKMVRFRLTAPNGRLNSLAESSKLKIWTANTRWEKRTSEHARCAAMLVWNA
jgi:hypothetical protein